MSDRTTGANGASASCGVAAPPAKERAQAPSGADLLSRLPRMGTRRLDVLHRELGAPSLEQLCEAAEAGRIRALRGFGVGLEQAILAAARAELPRPRGFPLAEAQRQAEAALEVLRSMPGVEQAAAAGSVRRRTETVGTLDLLVAANPSTRVLLRFPAWQGIERLQATGPASARVTLRDGMRANLRVVRPRSFGAALLHFTGPPAHVAALRERARSQGLRLNEHGLYRNSLRLGCDAESAIYQALGIRFVEPELRDGASLPG
jgi:DNA polymerase (family 10)